MLMSCAVMVGIDEVKPAKKLAQTINARIKNADNNRFKCSFLLGFFIKNNLQSNKF